MFSSEVSDSRTGHLVTVRGGQGTLPDVESCWDATAAVVAVAGAPAAAPRRPVPPRMQFIQFKYGPYGPYMDFLPEIYGLTVHIYGLSSRSIGTDGSSISRFPNIQNGWCSSISRFPDV